MNAVLYLQKQLANINAIYHGIIEDFTKQEWTARPAVGQNMVGYIAWHIPRTQDMHVQTWIRGIPEVFHGDRWNRWRRLKRYGTGVGITLAEADEIVNCIQRDEVVAYADAVHQEIAVWLRGLSDSDLEQRPDTHQNLAEYSEYQTPSFVEEAGSLFNQPIWSQLLRPCIGHVYRHLGELEVVKHILRTPK